MIYLLLLLLLFVSLYDIHPLLYTHTYVVREKDFLKDMGDLRLRTPSSGMIWRKRPEVDASGFVTRIRNIHKDDDAHRRSRRVEFSHVRFVRCARKKITHTHAQYRFRLVKKRRQLRMRWDVCMCSILNITST